MSATPTPIYSLQGFSPRVIDGYWHEFDDETQTFKNTYIKAEATIITEGTVVDYPEKTTRTQSHQMQFGMLLITKQISTIKLTIISQT